MTNHLRPGSISIFFIFIVSALISATAQSQDTFVKTPGDYEGPFYPIIRQQDEDNDLIHVTGKNEIAQGEILYLSGRVIDTQGNPLPKATVEIWQTDANGLYLDKRDTSPGKRDPNFQYWGKAMTKTDGSFSFTTIVPGKYEPRPAHIHFKVWVNDTNALTSQIYFRDHPQEKNIRYRTNPLQTVELQKNENGDYKASIDIIL